MDVYKVKIYPTAKQDLREIIDYLNTLSEQAALRYYDLLIEKIGSLSQMPLRCPEAAQYCAGSQGLPVSDRRKLSCVLCGRRGHRPDSQDSVCQAELPRDSGRYHFIKSAAEAKQNAPAAFLQVSAGTILPEKLQRQQCAFCKGGNCVDNRRPANHFTAGSIPPRRRTAAASRKPRTYQIIFESPHFIQCCHCGLYRLNFSLIKTLFNFLRCKAVGKQLVHVLW